jgi:hypothetical protein
VLIEGKVAPDMRRVSGMKRLKQILVVLALVTAVSGVSCPVSAQQQPIDTRQYAVNPPQSAVGVRQLPNQRAYPVDQWGRQVAPRGRGAIVIPNNDEHPRIRFQPYAPSHRFGFFYHDRLGLYRSKYRQGRLGRKR